MLMIFSSSCQDLINFLESSAAAPLPCDGSMMQYSMIQYFMIQYSIVIYFVR